MEGDTLVNPGRDGATNQIRRKEPQIPTTTNYNRVGTKYNEAKTNRSPARGSEFSGKSDIPNTPLDSTSQPVPELDPGKDVPSTSQTVTQPPRLTLAGTSASSSDGSNHSPISTDELVRDGGIFRYSFYDGVARGIY